LKVFEDVFDGDFRVNMYRKSAISGKQMTTQTTQMTIQTTQTTQTSEIDFTENDKAILKIVQNNPRLTQKELSLELNWTVDREKYYLNKMKKQGVIRRVGSSHNGYWELLIEARLLDA
jgi:predicted HTH transcriptional regulator